jgi:hypothetical protein
MTQDTPETLILGRELDRNNQIHGFVGLPREAWNRHLLIAGASGSGKSTTATHAVTSGHAAIDGATVVIDPKGDGWPTQLLRAHYKQHGSLENVYYFDLEVAVPAISFFDLRPHLDAGIHREFAIKKLNDQFLELLDHVKPSGFDAIRSPDVIRYLVRALFDPVHGEDAFPITDLIEAAYQLRRNGTVPEVSTDVDDALVTSLTDGPEHTRDQILQGAVTRIEKFYGNGALRPMFEQSSADPADAFRFDRFLTEDALLVFDLGGLSNDGQRVIANTLLSQLWWALKRRTRRAENEPATVLAFIDEIAQLHVESRLEALIALGRGHKLGLIPMLQFPSQLETTESNAEAEVLTNIQSYLLGQVPNDDALVARLADSTMSEAELRNRLTELPLDRWLFKPASMREIGSIPPHMIAEAPLPAGHPDSPNPLTDAEETQFEDALDQCRTRTDDHYTVSYGATTDTATETAAGTEPGTEAPHEFDAATLKTLDTTGYTTTLPFVDELPDPIAYDPDRNAITCTTCDRTYTADINGIRESITCHATRDEIDAATIPPVKLGVTLTPDEIDAAPVTTKQLCALQLLYNIAEKRHQQCELDLVHNQLTAVLRRLSIDTDTLNPLVEAGYLTRDQLKQYVYYTVTAEGRDILNESNRKTIDWGDGTGDLTESLLHRVMVEALFRYVKQHYVDETTSPVTSVQPYYELTPEQADAADLDGRVRLDIAGFDTDGDLCLAGEAERKNNDYRTAAVTDYDQLAALDVDHALWVVPSSSRGQTAVLQPLGDPPDSLNDPSPRIKQYSPNTRIEQISGIDAPGMTDIFTLNELRAALTAE